MNGNGDDKEPVEERPGNAPLGATQDLAGRETSLDRIDHHRDVSKRERHHDDGANSLQHVETKIEHPLKFPA